MSAFHSIRGKTCRLAIALFVAVSICTALQAAPATGLVGDTVAKTSSVVCMAKGLSAEIDNNVIHLYNQLDGSARDVYLSQRCIACAFTGGGDSLVYISSEGSSEIIGLTEKHEQKKINLQLPRCNSGLLAVSSDGKDLVFYGQDAQGKRSACMVIDISNPDAPRVLSKNIDVSDVTAIAVRSSSSTSARGDIFFGNSFGQISVETIDGSKIAPSGLSFPSFWPPITQIAFNRDNDYLFVVDGHKDLRLIDPYDPDNPKNLDAHDVRRVAELSAKSSLELRRIFPELPTVPIGRVSAAVPDNPVTTTPPVEQTPSVGAWEPLTNVSGESAPRTLVSSLAFSGDSYWLASGNYDGNPRVWDVDSSWAFIPPVNQEIPAQVKAYQSRHVSVSVACSGNDLVAVGQGDSVALLRLDSKGKTSVVTSAKLASARTVNTIALAPNGSLLAAGTKDGTVSLWSLNVDDPSSQFAPVSLHMPMDLQGQNRFESINSVGFSPDGGWFIALGRARNKRNGIICLWRVNGTGLINRSTNDTLENLILSHTFNTDGSVLAIGDSQGHILTWQTSEFDLFGLSRVKHLGDITVDSIPEVALNSSPSIYSLAFDKVHGTVIAGTKSGLSGQPGIFEMDLEKGTLLSRLFQTTTFPAGCYVEAISISPSGKRLAIGVSGAAAGSASESETRLYVTKRE